MGGCGPELVLSASFTLQNKGLQIKNSCGRIRLFCFTTEILIDINFKSMWINSASILSCLMPLCGWLKLEMPISQNHVQHLDDIQPEHWRVAPRNKKHLLACTTKLWPPIKCLIIALCKKLLSKWKLSVCFYLLFIIFYLEPFSYKCSLLAREQVIIGIYKK